MTIECVRLCVWTRPRGVRFYPADLPFIWLYLAAMGISNIADGVPFLQIRDLRSFRRACSIPSAYRDGPA